MSDAAGILVAARAAQAAWERTPLPRRLAAIRGLRHALAKDPDVWAKSIVTPQARTHAESLAGDILPLADACRWLEKQAARTLKTRRSGGLLAGLSLAVERKPHGVVLVIGASNYPLLLLAAPAIQALAAGNAVLLKPPPGAEAVIERFHQALIESGVDPRLCPVLDSSVEATQSAIAAGLDHIVATGSSHTGRAVARSAAETLTPCTLECSGSDAVIVLPGADIDRTIECVAWGLTFNSASTCIGPRRLIEVGPHAGGVVDRVVDRLADAAFCRVPPAAAKATRRVLSKELAAGSRFEFPESFDQPTLDRQCDACELPPVVLTSAVDDPSSIASNDLFAPVLSCDVAKDADEAIRLANASPYALGASVFGPAGEAERVAKQLRAGCVTVNDLIAPTADPGVPFGGAGESGYGVTRGAEGLLAMTRPQAVVRRRGRWLPHLDPPTPALDDLLAGMIQSKHADGWRARFAGLRKLVSAAMAHRKATNQRDTESTEGTTQS